MNDSSKLNLVCPHCGSINRVPEAKLQDGPICGKCKRALLPAHPVELTEQNFSKFIQRTELPIIVDFWAPWCGPCRTMAPAFAEAAGLLSPLMILAKLNTEEAPQVAGRHNISGIPTLIRFQGGREVARVSGMLPTAQIVQWARTA